MCFPLARLRPRRWTRILATALTIAAVVTGAAVSGAGAQETPPLANPAVEARRDALFQAMLIDPSNLDVAFEYAMLSAEIGDFEGAIATLERMLIYAPNLPRIQLELGVLYYRLGATDLARSYLTAAREAGPPPQVVERIDTFLAQIDRQDRRLTISGSVHGGLRYQSNATASPDDAVISINGIPVRLDQDARARADGNVFGLADLHIAYDLKNQNDLIEANIVTYNSVFFDVTRLGVNLIEAQVGPSFGFGRFGLDGTRLGVYGIAGVTALGYDLYSTQYGAGARLQSQLRPWLLWDARGEFRNFNYHNSETYRTVRQQTGQEINTSNQLTAALNARLLLQAGSHARFVFAREGYNSYDEFGAAARAIYYFYLPQLGPLAADSPWSASVALGGLLRRYQDPDPLIDPQNEQHDDVLFVEAGLSAPLNGGLSAFATGQVRWQSSNYPTRDFTNAVLTVGLSKRF